MSQSISQSSIEISNKAEGETDDRELLEPMTRLRTSVVPIIKDNKMRSVSDTGVNFMVKLDVDGKDLDDEQDASLTHDETQLKTATEPDTETSLMTFRSPVLIVEDTVELAEVIQATLEAMSIESIYETHGKNGVERLKQVNPELIIMDIGLPDITGWKMLDHIKDHYNTINAPMPTIIVITAYGDPANRLIGKLQNIHSYLLKPFTPDQVEQLVGMVLRGEKPEDPNFGGETSATS
ncbi:MAG: response regulator [Anaerolineae bacterium]